MYTHCDSGDFGAKEFTTEVRVTLAARKVRFVPQRNGAHIQVGLAAPAYGCKPGRGPNTFKLSKNGTLFPAKK